MGRMLEALKQAEGNRGRPAEPAPAPHRFQPAADGMPAEPEAADLPEEEEEAEVPFIEVGGRGPLEASPSVLAATPARFPKAAAPPSPPVGPPHIALAPLPAPAEPAAPVVAFRPLPPEAPPLGPPEERFAPELVAFHRPDHPVSEQYRGLLRSLAGQLAAGKAQVLLLTAAAAGAGTTTALLNLAITAAREGKRRVAVVDAEVYRPALAERLGLPAAPGLRDVLAGTISLQRALRETGQPNLHALTAEEAGPATGPRLAGAAMGSVLRHLRARFDLVLVDAPPWDGRPDVVALGSFCDCVYLVVGHDQAQTPEVDRLLQLIPQQGGCLRGCILTRR